MSNTETIAALSLPLGLALGLPLLVFVLGFLWKNGRLVGSIATLAVLASFLCTAFIAAYRTEEAALWQFTWLQLGERGVHAGILIDNLSSLMLMLVSFISFLVHLFSLNYMRDEQDRSRYFSHLGLFTFAMMAVVVSSNLIQLFVFWELVGLCSYLLIGFYRVKKAAGNAAKKAFIINRVADMGFFFGIMCCFAFLGSTDLLTLNSPEFLPSLSEDRYFWAVMAGLGFFIAALGKSAQFPFHLWLPDAMEGPTPVSALIHAATMVVAGIFLLARIYLMLDISILDAMAVIGSLTALLGAFAALAQTDIKKVLAYSTISQLGFMMVGLGTGGYGSAIFHLVTHAFFKAGLFLSAGAVILAIHRADTAHEIDAQDMRLMGGLRQRLPVTFACHLIFAFALAGIPLFSGFLSKDPIILQAFVWADMQSGAGIPLLYLVPIMTILAAFLTAFYIARQIFMVYFGENRLKKGTEAEQSIFDRIKLYSPYTGAPLVMLAAMSTFLFFSANPFSSDESWAFEIVDQGMTAAINARFDALFALDGQQLLQSSKSLHVLVSIITVALALLGFTLAFFRKIVAFIDRSLLGRLSRNSLYIDRLYGQFLVPVNHYIATQAKAADRRIIDGFIDNFARATVILGHVMSWFDRTFIDGTVRFTTWSVRSVGTVGRSAQGGKVQAYLLIAVLTSLLLITAAAIGYKN